MKINGFLNNGLVLGKTLNSVKKASNPVELKKFEYSIYNSKTPYHFSPISFGYKLKGAKNSHLDYYGANYNQDGTVTFRVYSAKPKIELQIADSDHKKKYWEPLSSEEEAKIGVKNYPMVKSGNVFEITPDVKIKEGTLYRFKVEDENGNISYLKDPRTYSQPHDAMGWSGTYNQNKYEWHDEKWQKGLDKRRIKHSSSSWGPEKGMVISEKHIGLLGGYKKAKKEIDKIAKDGICNTIYVLPLGEFFGKYNIGYDEVDKFAPESSYGTPDELKSLVDYAHQKGINIILDVVPNHFGFIGASAGAFAPSINESKNTGWGAALEFDGEKGHYMRKFMSDMMINWIVNYHFDGLRIDATEKLDSDPFLKYFASEIRNHKETKDSVLIPEHIDKTRKLAQPLTEDESKDPLETYKIAKGKNLEADSLGYDIQYIYDFKNTIQALCLNMQMYDCPPSISDLAKEFMKGNRFYDKTSEHLPDLMAQNCFVYPNMHDEYNVFGGVRFVVRAIAKELNLAKEDKLTSPDGLDKRPYLETESMLFDYLQGKFDKLEEKGISKEEFEKAYNLAKAKNRLILALTFIHPGQKGFSMGDETGELQPLRYFAEYETDDIKESMNREKGYDVGESAFRDSSKLFNKIKDKTFQKQTTKLSKDFTRLISDNSALSEGNFNTIIAEPIDSDSIFIHRWSPLGNDIFAVANFSNKPKTYKNIESFPKGSWHEVLNTDDLSYGGEGKTLNNKVQTRENHKIELAPYSFTLFKRK